MLGGVAVRQNRMGQSGLSRRAILSGAAVAAAVAALPTRGRAQPVSPHGLSEFFDPEAYTHGALSPSGATVALIRYEGENDARRAFVEVIDAADITGPRRRVPIGPHEIEALEWANEERVLVRLLVDAEASIRGSARSRLIQAETYTIRSRRVVSIDVNTGDSAMMFENTGARVRTSLDLGWIVDLLRNDPDHVLMAAWESSGVLALHRVHIHDGDAEMVERGARGTFGWHTQDGVAVIRRDINARGNVERVHARAPGEREWRFVRQVRVADAPDFAWIAPSDRPGVGMVSVRLDGEDVESVRELDLRTLQFGEPLSRRDAADVAFGLTDDAGLYLGAAYYGQKLEYDFVDPELTPHYRAMNRFFEDACNVAIVDIDQARNRILVAVDGPREPGAFYLYDRTARHFEYLGSRRMLDATRLSPGEALRAPTRDGQSIDAFLTQPPGGAPGPLVVLAHGGPEVRDHLGWNRQVQVLAAQGWWVLQPNFRGSGGYGRAFAEAGWKRWGDRMQEDVEDAVAHAIELKGLDASRVAIMGSSYGGYAALMGAVRRPDLYKAAIGVCGLYDLPDALLAERRDDDSADQIIYRFWTDRMGDPSTDRAALEAASPRRRAGEIACPVLLVHGEQDTVVSVMQSTGMRDALERAGKTIDYVQVNGAGHADWEDAVEEELMGRYVAFLDRAFA